MALGRALLFVVLLPMVALAEPADPAVGETAMEPTALGIEQARDASGTAWQPDSTPMFMWQMRALGWRLGLHTNAFFGYDHAAGSRGDDRVLSVNWLMAMASRPIGTSELTLRAMLSAEPVTMAENGYPLLLQTGESFEGQPLHDRQHPHDLFMELAARYRQPIGDAFGFEVYVAPVGEPAIGPAAFPHRFTSAGDPLAPLGHHWFDSTHITFGVLTAGVFTRTAKLEGSWFNGREPDERRWDFDFRRPDSVAARLSVNPTRDLSAQVSWARLDSPEELEPDISIHRITASATWNRRLANHVDDVAVSAAYGRNVPSSGPSTHAGLVESTAMFRDTHTVFGRVEVLTKTGRDLVLPANREDQTFAIASFSAGYVYDVHELGPIVPGIGIVGTVDVVGPRLGEVYDSRTPWGGMVFVRVRPPVMKEHIMPMSASAGAHVHHDMNP